MEFITNLDSYVYYSINTVLSTTKFNLGYKIIFIGIACGIGTLLLFLIFYFRNYRYNKKNRPLLLVEDTIIVDEEHGEDNKYSYFNEISNRINRDNFIIDIIARNRHGIAIFGYSWNSDTVYSLYWINSLDGEPFKVECSMCGRYPFKEREMSISIAESKDGKYKFERRNTGYYINNEVAELIS